MGDTKGVERDEGGVYPQSGEGELNIAKILPPDHTFQLCAESAGKDNSVVPHRQGHPPPAVQPARVYGGEVDGDGPVRGSVAPL